MLLYYYCHMYYIINTIVYIIIIMIVTVFIYSPLQFDFYYNIFFTLCARSVFVST
jgi:hypothetical protein